MPILVMVAIHGDETTTERYADNQLASLKSGIVKKAEALVQQKRQFHFVVVEEGQPKDVLFEVTNEPGGRYPSCAN